MYSYLMTRAVGMFKEYKINVINYKLQFRFKGYNVTTTYYKRYVTTTYYKRYGTTTYYKRYGQ